MKAIQREEKGLEDRKKEGMKEKERGNRKGGVEGE